MTACNTNPVVLPTPDKGQHRLKLFVVWKFQPQTGITHQIESLTSQRERTLALGRRHRSTLARLPSWKSHGTAEPSAPAADTPGHWARHHQVIVALQRESRLLHGRSGIQSRDQSLQRLRASMLHQVPHYRLYGDGLDHARSSRRTKLAVEASARAFATEPSA